MKQLRFLHIIFGMVCASYGFAQDSARIERATLTNLSWQRAWENPANYGNAFQYSHSELTLNGNLEHSTSPFILEKGKGHRSIEAKAASYLRLSERTTIWGKASYLTGRNLGVSWNSTADYDLLAPYILADSVGGNIERERYQFSGGYATSFGRWNLGAELQFRAEQEWRKQDPRMKGVVADLNLKLGATYLLGSYRLGTALLGNVYKQSNDVDIYNELGGTGEYIMTGLGTHYKRFSGANTDVSYKGKGGALLLSIVPISGRGIVADAKFSRQNYERISDEYNSLPLTTLHNSRASTQLGYRVESKKSVLWLYGHYDILSQHGVEHVAGDAVLGDYPIIADLTMYKHYATKAYLGTTYTAKKQTEWSIGAKIGFVSNRSKYVYPHRKIEVSHFFSELSTHILQPFAKQWLLDCGLTATYFGKSNNKIEMPYTDIETSFTQYINYNYSQLKSNRAEVKANIRTDYKLKTPQYGVFAELSGGIISNSEHTHSAVTSLTLGFSF